MREPTDQKPRVTPDVGQIAAAIGALSAVALFVAASFTYSFARGLTSRLLFPAQIMTLRTSADIFRGIVSQNTVVFLAVFLAGFVMFPNSRGRINKGMVWISISIFAVLAVIGDIWDEHHSIYRLVVTLASLVAPAFVGYAYHVYRDERGRGLLVVALMCFVVLDFTNSALYQYGFERGTQIANRSEADAPIGTRSRKHKNDGLPNR